VIITGSTQSRRPKEVHYLGDKGEIPVPAAPTPPHGNELFLASFRKPMAGFFTPKLKDGLLDPSSIVGPDSTGSAEFVDWGSP
jgi:hypothetical protein